MLSRDNYLPRASNSSFCEALQIFTDTKRIRRVRYKFACLSPRKDSVNVPEV